LQRAVNSILFRGPSRDLPAVVACVSLLAQTFLSWSVGRTEPAAEAYQRKLSQRLLDLSDRARVQQS